MKKSQLLVFVVIKGFNFATSDKVSDGRKKAVSLVEWVKAVSFMSKLNLELMIIY